MLSTWKLLTISTLLIGSNLVAANYDSKVIDFEKNRIKANKRVDLKDVTVFQKKDFSNGWTGYILELDANVAGKSMNVKDVLFTDGKYIAPELIDMRTGKSLKNDMNPTLSEKYYNKKHLIVGNENAKHKIIVFSDPLCPFCIDFVPEVIKFGNKNPNDVAIYYYHFPLLRLHPAADVITKAMLVAEHNGVKSVVPKIYGADFDKYFDAKETDADKILDGVNKVLGTKITKKDITDPKIVAQVNSDIKMGEEAMVTGTPTIYVNGEKDTDRTKWEKIEK